MEPHAAAAVVVAAWIELMAVVPPMMMTYMMGTPVTAGLAMVMAMAMVMAILKRMAIPMTGMESVCWRMAKPEPTRPLSELFVSTTPHPVSLSSH